LPETWAGLKLICLLALTDLAAGVFDPRILVEIT